ncbi:trypsin-like peptidase domain-containing protein [Stieleria sp. JC731]|uniref:S1C family serine protease n=1 Tax=Pirellulaceae TaxID=2691357 RepID=UPI001E55426F|nr:trypsin-like peptidase domain-containing protein [Stieleria sp. JC731]MCC9600136.1 trypsin-like peptidase domain-containing protein [Stieleria sp. JC731]
MQLSRILTALVFSWLVSTLLGLCLSDPAILGGRVIAAETPKDESGGVASEPADVGERVRDADADSGTASADSVRPLAESTTDADLIAAVQAGPRALSLAFRMAAKRATGSVVVLFAYGQGEAKDAAEDSEEESDEPPLPLLEHHEIPTVPPPSSDLPPNPDKLTGLGSGVVLSADGLIVTNNHVIKDASRIVVQMPDETWFDAEVFRGDPDSDIGIVRIKKNELLQPIEVGDSDSLEIGDWVLAIGSPFKLQATVSAGIISGKDRHIERIPRSNMLQTDAAINPGNSGGALIDLNGRMIGISTAIATRTGYYQGVGFAVPINQAIWIADELDKHGEVRRAAIGTTLVDLKPRIAKQFDLPPYSGILVYQVIKDSVAEKAGIERLDVIVEFAGEQVRDSTALQRAIERQKIGSDHPIVVRRNGKLVELNVQLATVDDPTGVK